MAERELDLSTLSPQQLDGLKKNLEKVGCRGLLQSDRPAMCREKPLALTLRRASHRHHKRLRAIFKLMQDVEALTSNFQQLKEAQERYADSAASLASIPTDGPGREVMVPLTSSLYVPGTLSSTEEVLVDIGTGFYVGGYTTTTASRTRQSRAG